MFREALLIAGKDLRIERRSRVALNQVAPFALLILVLFGFALDANTAALRAFTPGLYWVAVLLVGLLAVQRSFGIEAEDGTGDGLLMAGLVPAAVFAGKALAVWVQLLALQVLLIVGVIVLFEASVDDPVLLVVTALVATVGVAAAGTLYGALVAGLRVRETMLPILLLPVLAPVLIGATRAFGDAMGSVAVDGWAWLALLALFAVVYLVFGALSFGVLLEES